MIVLSTSASGKYILMMWMPAVGLNFPFQDLQFTVQPKKGRAVIWPSLLNEDPNANDGRTDHGALPVQEGIKYGTNAWIHQKDNKAVMAAGRG